MTDTTRKTLVVSGVVALVGSIVGLVLGLFMVNNLSDYLTQSVAVSESALGAVEETLGVLESVSVEVDEGIGAAAASIAAASDAVLTASGELDDVADFLDGELQASIETSARHDACCHTDGRSHRWHPQRSVLPRREL